LALVLAGAFFYFTTWRSNGRVAGSNPVNWLTHPAQVEITEASGGEGLDSEEQNNISVYRKNIPSVVNVTSRAMSFDFFYGMVPQEGQGSGFVIDREGHILTNYHVVADARQVEVTMHNRKKYKATVVGTDPAHDLAVIQIKAPDLVPSVLGDSRNLQVGQKVYAIGNPFGLAGTMTRGIVSSIRPVREPNGATIDEAIQTDAAINPGNSGGPLLDSAGRVIGVTTAILSPSGTSAGIGFAIPIDIVNRVVPEIIRRGFVPTPGIGIATAGEAEATRAGVEGVVIVRTIPGSSAERAGLRGIDTATRQLGDVIVGVNGKPVRRLPDLAEELERVGVGKRVTLAIKRGGRDMSVDVEVMDVGRRT
jgi:2-alkenal reductase